MDLAQEAAGLHAVYLGFGYDDLIKTNTAWILSRVNVKFIDTPLWREDVTLTTWHKGFNRLFFLRDFVMTDKEGRERVKATTSWLVLNLETRSMVRDPELVEEGTVCSENAIENQADKVRMPRDVEAIPVYERLVGYSDVDMLGHANSAMYMQWAMDAVDYELASAKPVKEFTINFNHEIKAGEKVTLYRACVQKEDALHVFIEGKTETASSFCVEIIF
jgi:acyl-ACP thioesterase